MFTVEMRYSKNPSRGVNKKVTLFVLYTLNLLEEILAYLKQL